MCGIAGLFIKDRKLESQLGSLLAKMTTTLCGRGPDSAGFAIYGAETKGNIKITVQGALDSEFSSIAERLAEAVGAKVTCTVRYTHAVFSIPEDHAATAHAWLEANEPKLIVVSDGRRLEIYKEVGYPNAVAMEFGIASMGGTHGLAHTRMATESAVTTDGAHPFSTGEDQCLVHNGSLSNHASIRRTLGHDGIKMRTQNDSEVAAGYISRELRHGKSLGQALDSSLKNLDGFFTFVVGTKRGFGVLRDPIACKPAVMAETDEYVAFASEYKSLTCLPEIGMAKVWEPKPAQSYFWEHK